MSQQEGQHAADPVRYGEREVSEGGTVGAMLAAILMILGGLFGSLQGIALIAKGSFYVQPKNYWINTSASTWGWILLIVGVVVLAAGIGVLSAAAWARWLGIVMASVQAVANFLFIPVQPWWSFTLILIDLWVIHSLLVHQRVVV
jgi:multisubunit Na+/H+ antiporter MnhG subunit